MAIPRLPFTLNPSLRYTPTTFGSASFTTEIEARDLGVTLEGEGKKYCPYIGTYWDFFNVSNTYLFARKPSSYPLSQETELPDGNGHLLTIAPTRAGKGTGQIIVNLLTWIGSVLVIDIKGENYLRSAGYRKTVLQQKVFRFAPFEEISEVWNPILSIRANPESHESTPEEEEEDARYLTNLLITPSGSGDAAFWENSAKNFLEGLLLYVRTAPLQPDLQLDNKDEDNLGNQYQVHERSMREVRRLLSLDKDDFDSLLDAMGESKRTIIKQAGNNLSRLMSGHGKTGQSILAMDLEQTAVWAYQRLHKVTYKPLATPDDLELTQNDFSFEQLRDGNTSIYLIIPPDYLTEYRAVLRVMIGFAMRELRRSFVQYKKDDKHQEKPPVLLILDEFPQLAYMRPIEEALLYLAGYDVRFWFFVQDISQLQLHYKDSWQTFFANTGTQCFFGVSDIATANLVSEMAGKCTVQHTSKTYLPSPPINSDGQLYYFSVRDSRFYQLEDSCKSETVTNASRPLITPDEVMCLKDDEQIIFIKGIRPIRCYRPNYYDFIDLKERSDMPTPHEIDFL